MNSKRFYLWVGFISIFLFNIVSAAQEVIAGHIEQTISPFLLLFISFLIAAIFFHVFTYHANPQEYKRPLRFSGTLWQVNLLTLGGWAGYFYAVKYIEPAIVSTLIVGLGPLLALSIEKMQRKKTVFLRASDRYAAYAIAAIAVILVLLSGFGQTADFSTHPWGVIKGVCVTLVSAYCDVWLIYAMKKMSNTGCTPRSIMAHRFYAIILISFLASWFTHASLAPLWHNWLPVLVIAFVCITGGLLLLQYGVKYTAPFLLVVLSSTAPIFTLFSEHFDPRLRFDDLSSFFIILSCVIALFYALHTYTREKG